MTATTYRLLNLLVGVEYLVRLPDLHGLAMGRRAARLTGGGRCRAAVHRGT
jgi:hypothetical protein